MTMKILVTGVAGFIGWKVSELLLADGHTVVGVDSVNDAYDVRFKHWRLAQLEGRHGFDFYRIDITSDKDLRALCIDQRFDAVINLAARAGVRQSVENPWAYIETNVTGTLNLLELSREFGVEKFVLASSSSLYGKNNRVPYREEANTDELLSPYAASKKAAEVLCHTYHYLYGIDVTILRYFTVYGPAGRPDMSPFRFVQWISEGWPVTVYGDGTQLRDFTYVDDVARGTVAALKPLGYEIINLGSDRPFVLNDTISLIEELVGKKAIIKYEPCHPADVPATWADIGKAEKVLGWRPQVPCRDGFARLVEWYLENHHWTRDVLTT